MAESRTETAARLSLYFGPAIMAHGNNSPRTDLMCWRYSGRLPWKWLPSLTPSPLLSLSCPVSVHLSVLHSPVLQTLFFGFSLSKKESIQNFLLQTKCVCFPLEKIGEEEEGKGEETREELVKSQSKRTYRDSPSSLTADQVFFQDVQ